MKEACQPSFHISLSFVLFYFSAPHNPAYSSCSVNKLKYSFDLSSQGRNTKTDLALKQGLRYCVACNIAVVGNISVLKFEFTLRSRSWTAVIAGRFKGNDQGGKYSPWQWFLHGSPMTPSLSFPAQLRKGVREKKQLPHGVVRVLARAVSWDSGSTAEGATWGL